jgi:hypothetical protein
MYLINYSEPRKRVNILSYRVNLLKLVGYYFILFFGANQYCLKSY